jgi:hypothetical protein
MESRRRNGGRNMTAGMGVAPHNPPSWYFDVMQSTTWQWEAPTAPEHRKSANKDLSIPGIYHRFRTWLEQSDAGQAFIQPPHELSAAEAKFIAVEATMPAVENPDETKNTTGYTHEPNLPHDVDRLRLKLASLPFLHDGVVIKLCKSCGQSLAKRIKLGELSSDELLVALNPVDDPTRRLLANTNLIDRITTMIRREVLYGMRMAEEEGSNLVPRKIWKEVTSYVSEERFFSEPGNIAFFTLLLRTLPEAYMSLIQSKDIFSATRAIVQSEEVLESSAAKIGAMRAGKTASALSRPGEVQWTELSEQMATYLGSLTVSSEQRYKMRRMWLLIQAHSRYTTHEAFVVAYQTFVGSESQASRKANTWLLLLARLTATGSITRETRTALYDNVSQNSHEWVTVLGHLHKSEAPQARLAEMYSLITAMNAKNSFLQSVANTALEAADVAAIRDLAACSNDASFALRAFEATSASADHDVLSSQWHWSAWTPYLRTILQDKKLDSKLMRVITSTALSQSTEITQSSFSFLTTMARQYLSSPHLTDRQKLRRLEWCATRQRQVSGVVSFDLLKMIAEHVTDDLSKGQFGRTARLEWLLRLIDEMLGAEQAAESLKALRGWRWMIVQGSGRDNLKI